MIYKTITSYLEKLGEPEIDQDRIKNLLELIAYIQNSIDSGNPLALEFVCTHNSRRSHIAQIWAQVMSSYFSEEKALIPCYSAGTEVTAINKTVLTTLVDQGFTIDELSSGSNPIYSIRYSTTALPIVAFSKTIMSRFNPSSSFAAIMTCTDAEKNCPFVPGAEKRIRLPYADPKVFDGTPEEKEQYAITSAGIAREMKYIFSQIRW